MLRNHDSGNLFHIGIGSCNDNIFRHHFPRRTGHQLLKALIVLTDTVVINAGPQKINVMRYMRFYLFIQQVGVRNDTDQLLFVIDNRNDRYFMLHKHMHQIKDRRFRTGRNKNLFHNIRC